jgi:hypothetical protein
MQAEKKSYQIRRRSLSQKPQKRNQRRRDTYEISARSNVGNATSLDISPTTVPVELKILTMIAVWDRPLSMIPV